MFSGNGAHNATLASFSVSDSTAELHVYLNPVTNGFVASTQVSQSLNFADDIVAQLVVGGLYIK